jgi:hypothetical protein
MSFRNYPYARRPLINNADRHLSEPPLDESMYCGRCSLKLSYLKDKDIYFCSKCGWNLPDELLHPPPSSQEQSNKADDDDKPVMTGTRNDSSSSTQEEDIPIASQGRRANKRKKDQFDYLRKDDAYLQNYTLVRDEIYFSDDRTTLSGEELEQERLRRNALRARGKRIQ